MQSMAGRAIRWDTRFKCMSAPKSAFVDRVVVRTPPWRPSLLASDSERPGTRPPFACAIQEFGTRMHARAGGAAIACLERHLCWHSSHEVSTTAFACATVVRQAACARGGTAAWHAASSYVESWGLRPLHTKARRMDTASLIQVCRRGGLTQCSARRRSAQEKVEAA